MNSTQPEIPGTLGETGVADVSRPEELEQQDYQSFLDLAKIAYEEGEDFQELIRARWDANYSIARSEHPSGSKYRSAQYSRRSRIFRGKTEASIRRNEAAGSVAFFSNPDVVTIQATNQDDPQQELVADALHKLTNHRFDNMKWFLILLGAFHETMVPGDIISKQYWEDGKPEVELIPPESVKISPNAGWMDPVNTSPYVVIETPMFVGDVKEQMELGEWQEYSDAEILSAITRDEYQSTTAAREGQQAPLKEDISSVNDFSIVWVHENYIRKGGKEYVFFTLGTKYLLTDPELLEELYPHTAITGRRNLVMGTSTIEPFAVYKRSLTDRVKGTQVMANEIANSRIDNVKLVINKRWFAQRGANIDYAVMSRSVPGSIIQADDINAVKAEEVADVTGSSYQEQHLLNADFDELAGTFSNSSVITNRAMNDTVGGMNLLKGDSNALTEYSLRIFSETWAEPVVREVVAMIQMHEEEDIIFQVTGQQIPREIFLEQSHNVKVSVGYGATDPVGRVQKLLLGVSTLLQYFPEFKSRFDAAAISTEVFGLLGYQDGKKFFLPEEIDPQMQMLMDQIEQLVQFIESEQLKHNQKLEEIDADGRWKVIIENIRNIARGQLDMTKLAVNRNQEDRKLQQKQQESAGKLSLGYLEQVFKMMEAQTHQKEIDAKVAGKIEEGI